MKKQKRKKEKLDLLFLDVLKNHLKKYSKEKNEVYMAEVYFAMRNFRISKDMAKQFLKELEAAGIIKWFDCNRIIILE